MAKTLTPAELTALTAEELEALQLAVNTEVAIRIQNDRLTNRLVTVLTQRKARSLLAREDELFLDSGSPAEDVK